jgi:hypothetical protein
MIFLKDFKGDFFLIKEKCLIIKIAQIKNYGRSAANRTYKSATQQRQIPVMTPVTKNQRQLHKPAKARYKRIATEKWRGDSSPNQ